VKRGWRIFLKVLSFGLLGAAKAARRPAISEGLRVGGDLVGGIPDAVEDEEDTNRERPSAKHRGLR
jgi:hypothetical protein